METRTTVKIKSETDNLRFGFWIQDDDDQDSGEFIRLDKMTQSEIEQFADANKIPAILLDAMSMFVEEIKETVGADLRSIWKRLDNAGIE